MGLFFSLGAFISLQSHLRHKCMCVSQSNICMMYGHVSMAFVFAFKRAFGCASENKVLFCKRSRWFMIFLSCVCVCVSLHSSVSYYRVPPILQNEWFVFVYVCIIVTGYNSDLLLFSLFFLSVFLFYFISRCCRGCL